MHVHASQKVDVRDILDCDYKLIAQITGTAVLPDEKCPSSKTEVHLLLSMFSENCLGLIFRISTETIHSDREKI